MSHKHNLAVAYGRERSRLAAMVLDAIHAADCLPKHAPIALKPNLVVAKPSSSGATTDPDLARGVLAYLSDHGWHDFAIMEGSWLGADTRQAFRVCGYEDLAKEFGARLVDLKQDAAEKVQAGGMELSVCKAALQAGALIDLPVLKAHSQTGLTCALKNLKGCIPDREKRRFHTLGLHGPIARLGLALPVALVVVDAVMGDLSFEEGGNPVEMDRVIAGFDPVLVDAYAASLIGYAAEEIPYLAQAAALGAGCGELSGAVLTELNVAAKTEASAVSGRLAGRLDGHVEAREACSACYGPLLHALARLADEGRPLPAAKVRVGQGFRGATGAGPGIGNCTCGFEPHLGGCPPSALAIRAFLGSRQSVPANP